MTSSTCAESPHGTTSPTPQGSPSASGVTFHKKAYLAQMIYSAKLLIDEIKRLEAENHFRLEVIDDIVKRLQAVRDGRL